MEPVLDAQCHRLQDDVVDGVNDDVDDDDDDAEKLNSPVLPPQGRLRWRCRDSGD